MDDPDGNNRGPVGSQDFNLVLMCFRQGDCFYSNNSVTTNCMIAGPHPHAQGRGSTRGSTPPTRNTSRTRDAPPNAIEDRWIGGRTWFLCEGGYLVDREVFVPNVSIHCVVRGLGEELTRCFRPEHLGRLSKLTALQLLCRPIMM